MPEMTVLTALGFGFLLGIKHALDADHIVAVTTIVSHSRSVLRSALAGLSWGIGHTLVLLVVGFGVLALKLSIPDKLALSMEFVMGAMLVLLGISVIRRLRSAHIHIHHHGSSEHLHRHSHEEAQGHNHRHMRRPLLIGMVHGLAGSGAITLLVLGAMSSVVEGLLFLVLFGAGSILSMLIFSGLISLPFKLTAGLPYRLNLWIQALAGIVSVALGAFIMWQTGFVSGLLLTVI